uniref:Uncharacterized protein n=1 Tax=Nothoprocta perdicaria TaxID=30464 RepID=A0A8C6Z741_NOTPE
MSVLPDCSCILRTRVEPIRPEEQSESSIQEYLGAFLLHTPCWEGKPIPHFWQSLLPSVEVVLKRQHILNEELL